MTEMRTAAEFQAMATRIRAHALRMVAAARSSHIGGCLSAADLLAVLYFGFLNVDPSAPEAPGRDRFVMSKGHVAAALYATLAERGFFPVADLATFYRDGSLFSGHVTADVPGVEVSTGSLGHGLPIACGMALAGKRDGAANRVLALLGDGECDEGSTWEAVLFAPHHRLANLTVVVDYNKIQSFGRTEEVLDLEPFAAKWRAFGWAVTEIDGHDHDQIAAALANTDAEKDSPSCIIAHTVKGKGVSFMENSLAWHYQAPDPQQLKRALAELGVSA